MRREVDGVFEVRAQVRGDFAELLAAGADGVRQRAGEVRQWVDGGGFGAEDVADRAVAAVLAVDVGLEPGLVGLELAFEGGVVEVAYPAFICVDLRALLRGGEQAVGVEGDGSLQVHAGAVGVLLVAAVHHDPTVPGASVVFIPTVHIV